VLPQSWIVVDEMTMVDVDLMLALSLALPDNAHLVLLGDADQLPSIDPGAVFSDLRDAQNVPKVVLQHNYRRSANQSLLTELSSAPADAWFSVNNEKELGSLLEDWFIRNIAPLLDLDLSVTLSDYAVAQDIELSESILQAIQGQKSAQLLCVTRKFSLGSEALNRWFMRRAWRYSAAKRGATHIPGTPLIVTRNDYELGIYNGDIGIVVTGAEEDTEGVIFQRFDRGFYVPLTRIKQQSEPAFALTVHKAQGSEYDHVLLMLPQEDSPLLSRQLLYTALTRARKTVWIAGDRTLWRTGYQRQQVRLTGLLDHLS
jgi:exodeoxyribonuclease V alpha subunit